MTATITPELLAAMGGSDWTSRDGKLHRCYFNDLAPLMGLHVSMYGTGNVSGATLNGDHIANSRASELLGVLSSTKLWYDYADGMFHARVSERGTRDYTSQEIADQIVMAMRARIAAV